MGNSAQTYTEKQIKKVTVKIQDTEKKLAVLKNELEYHKGVQAAINAKPTTNGAKEEGGEE